MAKQVQGHLGIWQRPKRRKQHSGLVGTLFGVEVAELRAPYRCSQELEISIGDDFEAFRKRGNIGGGGGASSEHKLALVVSAESQANVGAPGFEKRDGFGDFLAVACYADVVQERED